MDFLVINKSVEPPKISRSSSENVHELTKTLRESGVTDFIIYVNLSDSVLSELLSKITLLETRVIQLESKTPEPPSSPAVFKIDDSDDMPPTDTLPSVLGQENTKRNAVMIKLVKKKLIPASPNAGVFEPKLLFSVVVSNITSKHIRAIKGDFVFSDLFGADIFRVSATINQKIKPKGTAKWDGEIVYNEFLPDHVHFASFKTEDLKLRLDDESIVYA